MRQSAGSSLCLPDFIVANVFPVASTVVFCTNRLRYLISVFFPCAVVKWTQFADFNENSSYSIGLEHRHYISSEPSIVPFSPISKYYDKMYCLWQLEDFPGVTRGNTEPHARSGCGGVEK